MSVAPPWPRRLLAVGMVTVRPALQPVGGLHGGIRGPARIWRIRTGLARRVSSHPHAGEGVDSNRVTLPVLAGQPVAVSRALNLRGGRYRQQTDQRQGRPGPEEASDVGEMARALRASSSVDGAQGHRSIIHHPQVGNDGGCALVGQLREQRHCRRPAGPSRSGGHARQGPAQGSSPRPGVRTTVAPRSKSRRLELRTRTNGEKLIDLSRRPSQ
jgi:hypothetical protein